MKLRPYQQKCIDSVFAELENNSSTLVVMPTASGKTVTFAGIIERIQPKRVLVIAHRQELIFQARDKIQKVTGLTADIEMGEYRSAVDGCLFHPKAQVIVSTIQTQISGNDGSGRMNKFDPLDFGLIIVDECLDGDSMISLTDGSKKTIREISQENKKVFALTVNEETGEVEPDLIIGKKTSKSKSIIKISLENGMVINCTENHPLMTGRGWIPAINLTEKDIVLNLSQDEPIKNSTCLWKPFGGCQFKDFWKVSPSKFHSKAMFKAKKVCFGKIQNFVRLGFNKAKGFKKWRMGGLGFFFQDIEQARIVRGSFNLLSKWRKKDHFNGVAFKGWGSWIGMVVYGRWMQTNGWCKNIYGGVRHFWKPTFEQVACGALGGGGECNSFQKGFVLLEHEQGKCGQILQNNRAFCNSINAIQALFCKGIKVQMLSKKISSETENKPVLQCRELQAGGRESSINKVVSKKQSEATKKAGGGFGRKNFNKALRYLLKGISDISKEANCLWKRLQDGIQKEKAKAILYSKPRGVLGKSKIAKIERKNEEIEVYDLCLSKNHNYFANGILVHNCHHAVSSGYKKVINYYKTNPNLKVVGFTASPDRLDEEALGQIFDTVAYDYEILDAIKDGWLVPVEQQMVEIGELDFSKVKTQAGDLNQADLQAVMMAEKPLHGVASATIDIIGNRCGIGFASSVEHAKTLADICNRHKFGMSNWVCGKTPEFERKKILADFQSGKIQMLWNCGVLTEGFDATGVEIVVMARPTKSRALYAQMAGRSFRPHESIASKLNACPAAEVRRAMIARSCKPSALIVDFVGNSGKHKLMTTADILGGNVSDEVIDEAVRQARKSGKPVRMDKSLEEEEKRLEEKKKRELQEMARKEALKGKAKFSASKVDPFDLFQIKPQQPRGWDTKKTLSIKMRDMLRKAGFDPDKMDYTKGKQMCGVLIERWNKNLCSFGQAKLLAKYKYENAQNFTFKEASEIITRIKENGWKPLSNLIIPDDMKNENPF